MNNGLNIRLETDQVTGEILLMVFKDDGEPSITWETGDNPEIINKIKDIVETYLQ